MEKKDAGTEAQTIRARSIIIALFRLKRWIPLDAVMFFTAFTPLASRRTGLWTIEFGWPQLRRPLRPRIPAVRLEFRHENTWSVSSLRGLELVLLGPLTPDKNL